MQELDCKIQILNVENMPEEELHNVCEDIDDINSEKNDAKTSHETKMFTMQFHVSKCREEAGLLQSHVDSGSESENSIEVQNGNNFSNDSTGNVQNNSTTGQNEGEKDVQE